MWRLAAILIFPVIEIALFVQVGRWLGLWPVVFLLIGAIVLGVVLLRGQAMGVARMMRQGGLRMADPSEAVVGGILRFVAAILFILPGLISDALAILLLLPPVQAAAARSLRQRMVMRAGATPRDVVIEGEFHEVGTPRPPTHPPLSNTRH